MEYEKLTRKKTICSLALTSTSGGAPGNLGCRDVVFFRPWRQEARQQRWAIGLVQRLGLKQPPHQ